MSEPAASPDRPDAERCSEAQLRAVESRLAELRQQLTLLRGAPGDDAVTIVAVTKGFGPWAIEAARRATLTDVGESYAQELVRKANSLGSDALRSVRVHFIGRLQTNKVRALAPLVHTYQSVDRPSLLAEIAKRAPSANVMIQLNLTGAATQGGCDPTTGAELVAAARRAHLSVTGAMTIGDLDSSDATTKAFRDLVEFADAHDLEHRSMGMSGDLTQALLAGSTMVRVGTSLFGERPSAGAQFEVPNLR